jgi:ribosome maturation factor RimP
MTLVVPEIEKIVGEFESENLFLIEVLVGGTPKIPKFSVVIDSETGVTIERCTKITRKINKYLTEGAFPEGNYSLEVSSPGADSPIKVTRQYIKNIGRKFKFSLESGNELVATLTALDATGLLVSYETVEKIAAKKVVNTVEQKINFSEIKKANVIITI